MVIMTDPLCVRTCELLFKRADRVFLSEIRSFFSRLGGQCLSALRSSAGECFSATIATHSFSKTMLVFTFSVAWLKRPFHVFLSFVAFIIFEKLCNLKNISIFSNELP